MSLGCGPAREVVEYLAECRSRRRRPLDPDRPGGEGAQRRLPRRPAGIDARQADCTAQCLYLSFEQLIRDPQAVRGEPQDFIYCVGMFDYLNRAAPRRSSRRSTSGSRPAACWRSATRSGPTITSGCASSPRLDAHLPRPRRAAPARRAGRPGRHPRAAARGQPRPTTSCSCASRACPTRMTAADFEASLKPRNAAALRTELRLGTFLVPVFWAARLVRGPGAGVADAVDPPVLHRLRARHPARERLSPGWLERHARPLAFSSR
jgi:hypothetical protein